MPGHHQLGRNCSGRNFAPAQHSHSAPLVGFVTTINEPWRECIVSRKAPRGLAGAQIIACDRLPRLDLHGLQAGADFKYQVGFQPIIVAPEIQAGMSSLKRPLTNSATTHVSNRAPRIGCRASTSGIHCDDAIVNLYRLRRASAFDRMGWLSRLPGLVCHGSSRYAMQVPSRMSGYHHHPAPFSDARPATRPLLATAKQPQQPFGEARYGLWVGPRRAA